MPVLVDAEEADEPTEFECRMVERAMGAVFSLRDQCRADFGEHDYVAFVLGNTLIGKVTTVTVLPASEAREAVEEFVRKFDGEGRDLLLPALEEALARSLEGPDPIRVLLVTHTGEAAHRSPCVASRGPPRTCGTSSCMVHVIDSMTNLREVVRMYAHNNAENWEHADAMRRFFGERFACAMINVAAVTTVANSEEDVSVGDLVGHFADHAFAARDDLEREASPIAALVDGLFKVIEQEATHQMAKRHSEGN